MMWPEDRDAIIEQALRLLTGEIDSYSSESRLLAGDGSAVWVHETATCVRDAAGNPLHFMSQFVDIGARKRLRRSATARARPWSRASRDLTEPGADPVVIGQRIVGRIAHPFVSSYGSLDVSVSIGLALGGAGDEPREIVHRADLAAYQAKGAGGSRLVLAPSQAAPSRLPTSDRVERRRHPTTGPRAAPAR